MKAQPLESPLASSKISLSSSAFPSTKPVTESSVFHQIIKQSQPLSSAQEVEMFQNVSLRLTNKQQDIIEIWDLQLQWFPLKYGQYFYERIIQNKYRCLVAEVEVSIEWTKLMNILKAKYDKEKAQYDKALSQGSDTNIYIEPSKYFEKQGIKTSYLLNPGQIPFQNKQNPKLKPIIKIKVIAGVMVFDLTASNGYLSGVWWRQNVFGTINSIYINTIGVLEEYRKHGLAKKMIEWVTDRTKKEGIFKLIYLHVIEYNTAAIKLYERLGFRHLDSFNAFYTVDEKEYKGELLGLFLNGGQQKQGWGQWLRQLWG